LLTTGRITLPVPEPHREYLRSIRRGERVDAWLHRSDMNVWTRCP
jgi:hypothetical protein